MPGIASATVSRCSRQRSPFSRRVTPLMSSLPQHSSPTFHVEVESLVQQRIEGKVPFTQVLHRLASGADLELDQTQMWIVLLQTFGDPTQVIDCGTRLQCVGDHLPLHSIGCAHFTLLRGAGAVGVPGVLPDSDPGGGGDEVT